MHDVFISYSKKDYSIVQNLRDSLVAAGLNVWIDDALQAGQSWYNTIDREIANSRYLVVVLSPNSYQSEWVRNEIAFGINLKKPIIPFVIGGKDNEIVPIELISIQYIDARVDYDDGLYELLRILRNRMPKTISASNSITVELDSSIKVTTRRLSKYLFAMATLFLSIGVVFISGAISSQYTETDSARTLLLIVTIIVTFGIPLVSNLLVNRWTNKQKEESLDQLGKQTDILFERLEQESKISNKKG